MTPMVKCSVKSESHLATSAVKPGSSFGQGQKRKSMADAIQDVAAADRNTRIKIVEFKEREKTARVTARERIKRKGLIDLEARRMEHDHREAVERHQHDLLMMDKQIELERIRAGLVSKEWPQAVIDPCLRQ